MKSSRPLISRSIGSSANLLRCSNRSMARNCSTGTLCGSGCVQLGSGAWIRAELASACKDLRDMIGNLRSQTVDCQLIYLKLVRWFLVSHMPGLYDNRFFFINIILIGIIALPLTRIGIDLSIHRTKFNDHPTFIWSGLLHLLKEVIGLSPQI